MRIRKGFRLPGLIVLGAGAILLAAGIFNLGGDDSLSFFLFLLVALLAWVFSRRAAASFSLSAVGLWLAAGLLRGFSEVDPLALYLMAAVRGVLCACVIVAVAAIQDALLREVFVHRAGHCSFTPAETIAALDTLLMRLDTGQWRSTAADVLEARAAALGALNIAPPAYIQFQPAKFLRPFSN